MQLPVRRSASLAMLAGALLLMGCGGAQPPAQPTIDPDETLLEPLPTLDANPAATEPPDASGGATPKASLATAAISCEPVPPTVGAGGSVFLVVHEMGDWYGTERYYTITGIPGQPVAEVQQHDGGPSPHHVIGFDVPEYFAGAMLAITVEMRDWDIHAPPALPGPASGSGRPESTHHRWACATELPVQ